MYMIILLLVIVLVLVILNTWLMIRVNNNDDDLNDLTKIVVELWKDNKKINKEIKMILSERK